MLHIVILKKDSLAYQESPIVKTIKKLLEQSPDGWKGTAQQLLEAGTYIARVPLADSTRSLAAEIKKLDRLLFANDNIVHGRKGNGTGGGKHIFHYADGPQFEEVGEQEEIGSTKDCVLTSSEQSAVDDRARALAQDDLAFGRISSGQFGQAVAQYAEKLTRAAKEEKVHTADLNRQIREAMMGARHA